MTKKGLWIITAVSLAVYTAVVILCFAFIPRSAEKDTNTNTASVRSYIYVDFSDEEKAAVYDSIGLDTGKLAARGFSLYREDFMSPKSYPKEIHVIELAFEDIYCRVSVYIHADEIKWAHEQTTVTYAPLEIIGLQFERYGSVLLYDDAKRGIMFVFDCSSESDSAIYKDFLSVFFNKENSL